MKASAIHTPVFKLCIKNVENQMQLQAAPLVGAAFYCSITFGDTFYRDP